MYSTYIYVYIYIHLLHVFMSRVCVPECNIHIKPAQAVALRAQVVYYIYVH